MRQREENEERPASPNTSVESSSTALPVEARDFDESPTAPEPLVEPIEMSALRQRLASAGGPEYWRSLEELADLPELQELVEREFPRFAPAEWDDGVSRRGFLRLASASLALAGLTACTRQPPEHIVPYVRQPEEIIPGKALRFATSMPLGGYDVPVLAESHMGRPTKLDGNPEHPASLGKSDRFLQAAILDLYDPDRSGAIDRLGRTVTWEAFLDELEPHLRAQEALQGEGLRILTEVVSSPTVKAQMEALLTRFPRAKWHQYDGLGRNSARLGAQQAFGDWSEVRYDFSAADVIVSLGADFLASGPGHTSYARDFASRRRVRQAGDGGTEVSRLYVLETAPTPTGTAADHRLPIRPSERGPFLLALAEALGVPGVASGGAVEDPVLKRWLEAIAADLESHRGRGVVVVGDDAPPSLHVLAHAIHQHLGSLGQTVVVTEPIAVEPVDQETSLQHLVWDLENEKVDLLLILGGNPVFTAPADFAFEQAMLKAKLRVHLGSHRDETATRCQWHLPEAHFLESWGDGRSFDGTLTLRQPLIEPLYEGRSALELLAVVAGERQSAYELVRSKTLETLAAANPLAGEEQWRRAVHDGFVDGTSFAPRQATVAAETVTAAVQAVLARDVAEGPELAFQLDAGVLDGRFANNGWLQELPKPITLLTWDNVALMSPQLAESLNVKSGEIVWLVRGETRVEMPVLIQPGHADDAVTLSLGYGREAAGRVGSGTGFDVRPLRTSDALWHTSGIAVERTGRRRKLATTQHHWDIETQADQAARRHLIKHGTLEQYHHDPQFVQHIGHAVDPHLTMFPEWNYDGYSWGMAIDLSTCTGCSACVIACQAENNIPVVGKDQVLRGREMHWLRIDRYYQGDLDRPTLHHQPVACMHCEKAPCEVVCPVAATVHGPEGLNEMVYNRCVGTRYCSNNCPYKVRRFNYLRFNDTKTPVLKMVRNPDVSVRSRGVMEKCTYCVQRINEARIEAKKEDRKIVDGEVRTACQEACPSEAIAFGDLNDPSSEVNAWKAEPTQYSLLPELSTAPRTTYLAKLRNPNPALADQSEHAAGSH